jgi:hypothetical protein
MVKSFKRLLPALIIALLVLVPALPVFAQGSSQAICSGLNDADCQTLVTAQANVSNITSFSTSAWSIDFKANDATTNVAFSASGSGEFVLPTGSDSAGLLIHLVIDSLNGADMTTTISTTGTEVIITDKMAFVKYNGDWYGQELTQQDLSGMGLGSFSSLGSLSNMFGSANGGSANGLSALTGIDLTGAVTTTRGADVSVGGQDMQVFTTSFDLAKLIGAVLASPSIAPLMGQAMGSTGSQMTPDQLQMVGAMIAPMLGTTSISCEEWVGSDANLHEIKLDVVLDIDPSLFSPTTGKITGEFHFSTDLSGLNQSYSVTPPTSYKPMSDLNAAMQSMSASG